MSEHLLHDESLQLQPARCGVIQTIVPQDMQPNFGADILKHIFDGFSPRLLQAMPQFIYSPIHLLGAASRFRYICIIINVAAPICTSSTDIANACKE